MKIDAHQHFWEYNPTEHVWIKENMDLLKRDYLPAHLQKELESNNMDGSIAVQASQSVSETEFLLSLARANNLVKAVVGWVDLRAKDVEQWLSYFKEASSLLKGFRHVIHDEADQAFILGRGFNNGISKLDEFGFTYDILIYPVHLQSTIEFISNHPNQKFVIDHLAKPYIASGEIEPWKKLIYRLGEFDNVWCKLSGLVTEAKWNSWKHEEFVPYLDIVLDAFGANRLMYGSDWPVCLLGGSYSQVKGIIETYTSQLSQSEQVQIFGKNAIDFYGIVC